MDKDKGKGRNNEARSQDTSIVGKMHKRGKHDAPDVEVWHVGKGEGMIPPSVNTWQCKLYLCDG